MNLAQKIITNLSKNKNVQSFIGDFDRISSELKSLSKDLNSKFKAEKSRTVQQALAKYQELLRGISKAQSDLDREVNKAIAKIIKSAETVEQNLSLFKKKAITQKAKIEKAMPKKQTRGRRKKVSSRGRKKKTTRSRSQ